MIVSELPPADRRAAEAELAARGLSWDGGRTLVARSGPAIAGLARLLDPNPGDGHHREHVRELVACGEPSVQAELARAALGLAGEAVRVEAALPSSDPGAIGALREAGLSVEATIPAGLQDGADLVLLGRPARARRAAPAAAPPPAHSPPADLELRWIDAATRPALQRFLDALVPGRAYPPGTLLSEAESRETDRAALGAPWLVAFDAAGEVVGALVLEREKRPGRGHVRLVHLDVVRAWRGRGVATSLVRRAIAEAGSRGARLLEAEPRAGNLGAVGALAAGGMRLAGAQVRAWRLRGPSCTWDEDVLRYWARPHSADAAPSGTSGDSGGSSSA